MGWHLTSLKDFARILAYCFFNLKVSVNLISIKAILIILSKSDSHVQCLLNSYEQSTVINLSIVIYKCVKKKFIYDKNVAYLRLGLTYFLLRFAQRPVPRGAWQALSNALFGFCKICSHSDENPKLQWKSSKKNWK